MPNRQDSSVVCDITEREQMENALRDSEARYRTFIEQSSEGIWRYEGDKPMPISMQEDAQIEFISKNAYLVECNDAYARMYGLARAEEIIGSRLTDVFLISDPHNLEIIRAFIRSGYRLKDVVVNDIDIYGNIRYMMCSFTGIIEDGCLVRVWGVQRDITQQKLMEDELRKARDTLEIKIAERTADLENANIALKSSKDYLDNIINSIADPIFVKDRLHQFVLVNEALCSMIGHSCDEILGKTDHDFFPSWQVDIFLEKDEEVFKTGNENVNEEQITDARGITHTIVTRKKLYIDSIGDKFIVGIIRDITDRKHAEEELKSAKEDAEAAAKAKSEFLANMSHEIRTPLNAIIGLTGLLQRTNLDRGQLDYVGTIKSSGDSLLSVINDILDFSKIDSGKIELETQPFEIEGFIEESLSFMAIDASKKGLNLSYDIDPDAPKIIIADPVRLRQILINLVSNAIKFTDRGEVVIEVSSRKLKGSDYELHFAIKDTGIGIPKEKVSNLFKPFSQVDTSTTRRYGGTGLGLVISKRLVELMGGVIWAESEVGKGSTFHFTIPIKATTIITPVHPKTIVRQVQADIHSSHLPSLNILLAEDNPVNQKVMLQMLHKLGYKADVAVNGFEVLQALERQPYDLILMDIQMPEMDGLEAAKRIRERWHDGPKIIAITAYAFKCDMDRCLNAGMDDYISKPIQLDDLENKLLTWGTSIRRSKAYE